MNNITLDKFARLMPLYLAMTFNICISGYICPYDRWLYSHIHLPANPLNTNFIHWLIVNSHSFEIVDFSITMNNNNSNIGSNFQNILK